MVLSPMASLGPTLISGKDQSQGSVCSTLPLSVSVKGASVGMKIHREDHGVLQGGDVEHGWGGEDQGRRGGLKVWGGDMEKLCRSICRIWAGLVGPQELREQEWG